MKRFFDYDADTHQTEVFHYDESAHTFSIETVHDVTAILENNKRQANDGDGYTPSREMKHEASIPLGVVMLWKEKYGVDVFDLNHAEGVKRLLNSSEWAYLRTSSGVI